ncbi:MAG TPA: hypothetical protein VNZ46_08610 [Pedobacter sp.]|nr:hypothetical protein [Pedobacter sp.]
MFDGIKFSYNDTFIANLLINDEKLNINKIVNSDGEIKSFYGNFMGLKLQIFPSGHIIIKGSLHKYYNQGLHNYNDFDIVSLKCAIDSLQKDFYLDPKLARIENIEFGVNISPTFDVDEFLDHLMWFRNKPFNIMATKGCGNGREYYFNQYGIKIYNKALQYGLPQNLLRVEKKITTMCALKFGKICLFDLLKIRLWDHCKCSLIEMFKEIIINEPFDLKSLKKTELKNYYSVVDKSQWLGINKDKRKTRKKGFNALISKYGSRKYQLNIQNLIHSKCNELKCTPFDAITK